MQHVAIMRKSWGLLPKLASGQKTIESRWYRNRTVPWDRIAIGDDVYFKNSGEPVTLRATVASVLQYSDLAPAKVAEILQEYGAQDGLSPADLPRYYELFKDKKYCLLIFLKETQRVEPFHINKQGYGAMAAWITVPSVRHLKMKIVKA